MNIKRKRATSVRVGDLKIGQTFVEDEAVFMRVRFEEALYCHNCDEDIDIGQEFQCLAVELRTGEIYDFESYSIVEPIECEVVEI